MKQNTNFDIPPSFLVAPFFEDTKTLSCSVDLSFKEGMNIHPFLFDILKHLGLAIEIMPWEAKEQSITFLCHDWQVSRSCLSELFRERNRVAARPHMINQINKFICALFWMNNQAVTSLINVSEEIKKLKVRPINTEERLLFIIENPDHYLSFTQLQELFTELEKQFQKQIYLGKQKSR